MIDYPTNCQTCHSDSVKLAPDVFTPWSKTAHGIAVQHKLNGTYSDGVTPLTYFPRSCMECHTVGDSPAAVNNGFDDIEKTTGWVMPTKLQPGNWENMVTNYPTLANLAGIQWRDWAPVGSAHHVRQGYCRQMDARVVLRRGLRLLPPG
jgi:hypothetical protein